MNAINGALQRFRVPYGEESRSGITEMSSVISFQKDRASANEVFMIGLQSLYKGSINLHCISHTITHVGEHMPANDAKRFMEDLCAVCNSNGITRQPVTGLSSSQHAGNLLAIHVGGQNWSCTKNVLEI